MKRIPVQQILALLTCVLVVAAVALNREGRLWGHDFVKGDEATASATNDTLQIASDGVVIVNTAPLCKEVVGYGGPVPLRIYVKDGVVEKVEAQQNSETPSFFERAAVLLDEWKGKSLDDAESLQVDAVSGATFSSNAIIANVRQGLAFVSSRNDGAHGFDFDTSAKALAGLAVALLAAIVPLFLKDQRYRIVQMILNVLILGFWCGTFISYSMLIRVASDGVSLSSTLVPLVMLVVAFVYPLFKRKNYYCTYVCPCGSAQELAGMLNRKKWKMSAQVVRILENFRRVLWGVLMLLMLTGVWSSWIDYELFTAFVFQSAPWVVLAIAVVFLLLSVFVHRPYCRFVCPTGTFLKAAQDSN